MLKYIFLLCSLIAIPGFSQVNQLHQGATALSEGNLAKALAVAEKAIAENPNIPEGWWLAVACELRMGELPDAARRVSNAREIHPNHLDLMWLQAEVYLQQQAYQEALNIYQKIPTVAGPAKQGAHFTQNELIARKVHCHTQLYLRLEKQGDKKQAQLHLERAVALQPKDIQLQKALVYNLLEQEAFANAIAAANAALQIFPEDADLLKMKGNAHFHLNQLGEMTNVYTKLYEKDIDDLETGLGLVELKLANSEANAAQAILEHLRKVHPTSPEVYEALITLAGMRNKPEEQLAWCDTALTQVADKEVFHDYKVGVLVAEKQYKNARNELYKLHEWFPKESKYVQQILYTFLLDKQAEAAFEFGLEKIGNFNDVALYQLFAKVAAETNNWEDCFSVLQTFQERENHPKLQQPIAVAAFQTARLATAKSGFEAALKNNQLSAEGYFYFGLLLKDQAETDSAVAYLAKALALAVLERSALQQQITSDFKREKTWKNEGWLPVQVLEIDKASEQITTVFSALTTQFPKEIVTAKMDQLMTTFPNTPGVLTLGATYFERVGQLEEALPIIEKSLSIHPSSLEGQLLAARIYEQQGQMRKAILSAERARGIDISNPEPYELLVRLHEKNGSLSKLAEQWQIRLLAERKNFILRNGLVQVLHKLDRFEEAQALLRGE